VGPASRIRQAFRNIEGRLFERGMNEVIARRGACAPSGELRPGPGAARVPVLKELREP